ncbi:MAG: hypothetical protein KAY24_01090 [Candidatus Eisenbacteria sp.]|nr:hypothetical protein [Candidatus Eisenbacteria bacterium]
MSEKMAPHYCPMGSGGGYCTYGSCALWSHEHQCCTVALPGLMAARIADALERIAPSATVMPLSPALRRVGREVDEALARERAAAAGGESSDTPGGD